LRLHHAERLIEDGLTRLTVISDLNETLRDGKSTTIWILVNGNAPPEGKFDKYATT
jgi:hypothetical protein